MKQLALSNKPSGQAMIEAIVILAFLIPLFYVIYVFSQYMDIQTRSLQMIRYAVWEQAITQKTEDTITQELSPRFLKHPLMGFAKVQNFIAGERAQYPTKWQDNRTGQTLLQFNEATNKVGLTYQVIPQQAPLLLANALDVPNFSQIRVGQQSRFLDHELLRFELGINLANHSLWFPNAEDLSIQIQSAGSIVRSDSWQSTAETDFFQTVSQLAVTSNDLATAEPWVVSLPIAKQLGESYLQQVAQALNSTVIPSEFNDYPIEDLLSAQNSLLKTVPNEQSLLLPLNRLGQ